MFYLFDSVVLNVDYFVHFEDLLLVAFDVIPEFLFFLGGDSEIIFIGESNFHLIDLETEDVDFGFVLVVDGLSFLFHGLEGVLRNKKEQTLKVFYFCLMRMRSFWFFSTRALYCSVTFSCDYWSSWYFCSCDIVNR